MNTLAWTDFKKLSSTAIKQGAGFKVVGSDGMFMFYVVPNVRMGMTPRVEGLMSQINSGLSLVMPEVPPDRVAIKKVAV
jgi:hypothetical protein